MTEQDFFGEAAMAMAALVAAADGHISSVEIREMSDLIASHELLVDHSPSVLAETFGLWCELFVLDAEVGRAAALEAVGRLRETPEQGQETVTLGLLIAVSDGLFHPTEAAAVEDAWRALGLKPAHLAF